ncbi:hypothetical protein K503DRAFT_776785 [Rhizopogon vinicolor AM-OR11-026]|uniref:Uncharacterized protein n=1 Tax=Rhizopogon vinicolor AM-OR11-026 TaxID=1314800 RepID=A0A1B7MI98_9AGAM|nr:hypothetical protein K503DRAFT_776785 [Rhizopogon vinicolor AM-OR11-026]
MTPPALSQPKNTSHWHTLSEQPSQTQTSSTSPSVSHYSARMPLPSPTLAPYNMAQLIARNECRYRLRRSGAGACDSDAESLSRTCYLPSTGLLHLSEIYGIHTRLVEAAYRLAHPSSTYPRHPTHASVMLSKCPTRQSVHLSKWAAGHHACPRGHVPNVDYSTGCHPSSTSKEALFHHSRNCTASAPPFRSSRDSVRWRTHVSDSYRPPLRMCAQALATRLAKRHKLQPHERDSDPLTDSPLPTPFALGHASEDPFMHSEILDADLVCLF